MAQNLIMQMMQQLMMQGNPIFNRAMQMGNGKNETEMEQVARNICQNKGLDYDKMKSAFSNQYGINF